MDFRAWLLVTFQPHCHNINVNTVVRMNIPLVFILLSLLVIDAHDGNLTYLDIMLEQWKKKPGLYLNVQETVWNLFSEFFWKVC